mmetsp:Transcript_21847/g.33792  ORF Transcript_21847/g.33792 Transcript_21847/m.33792 type:complete len:1355 (+) Transcript_21847:225-4289(+)
MSTVATSSSTAETTFLLSEWIRRAIDEVDLSALVNASSTVAAPDRPSQWPANIRNSMALCSDEYLMSALRVAHSLADGLCEAEDNFAEKGGRENNNDDDELHPSLLPAPGTNWADKVQVHLSSEGAEFNEISKLHFNLKSADFLPMGEAADSRGQSEDGMRRIYSLGIVLYEIFSGGERPPEMGEQTRGGKSDDGTAELSQELSQETAENLDLFPIDDVDIAAELNSISELNLFDDIIEDRFSLCNDIGGDDFFNAENDRKSKRQTQSCSYKVYDVSVEPLKAKCLPGSLCDLVANMLDCANGNPSGEDSYHNMSEVRDDLQLMLDKPAIYLYDQDIGRLSITGLQFGGTVFGRNAELSTVKDAYRRSVSGGSELVIISGASGSGKSLLVYESRKHVLAGGGIILSGKFDQLQQGTPFSAFASAFDVYCGTLLEDSGPSSIVGELASNLRSSLGRDVHHLTKLIPNLAIILGPATSPINRNEDCDNAQKRLQYLLCQFVDVISSTFSAPVTLFLDDLQWADAASIEAVNHLLTAASLAHDERFFFLGCCRKGEINEGHPVRKLLKNVERSSVGCTNIKLDLMDEHTINTMVSETLRLLPRLTRSLSSVIYHKTKGNPLFVSHLMLSLSKEGLLRPSLSRRRWEWEMEKIEDRELPDDVAMFLNNSIMELPDGVQSSLCILSCFGASANVSFIEPLERALQKNIRDDLDVAVAKGLLDKIGVEYRFSHDRIQEATYNMMEDGTRRLFHFTYGLSLASLSIEEECDGILFIAVNQLNLGGPAIVQDPSQSFTVAGMNLRAGKKAMEMSDFKTALSYLNHGISFLCDRHWEDHYDLSLELFEVAAKCALSNGDHKRVSLLFEQVSEVAHSFEDKLEITYTYVRSLLTSSCLGEALTKGLYVLNELGIVLSGDLDSLLVETKSMLAEHSDEQLLSLPVMTDRTKLMAMKILSRTQTCLLHTNPKSQPKATLHMVQYSLQHGMSGLSSFALILYGSFLACLGDIPAGYRYVKIAIRLAEKLNARSNMCEVLALGSQVMGYVEPLQSVNEVIVRSLEYGLAVGSIGNAMLSCSMNIVCAFWSGKHLSLVKSNVDDTLRLMSSHSTLVWILQTLPLYRTVLAMIGNVDDVPIILGSRSDIETEKERKMSETNLHLLKVVHFNKLFVGFMFRRYDEVKQFAVAYDAIASLPFNTILISHCMHVFYWGLINFWIARKTMDVIWFDRGEKAIEKMRSYAECSSWNFQNKLLLLQAEQCFYLEDIESAKRCYDAAILSAQEHKFVHEEALACELAGHFMLESGEGRAALPYFLLAQKKYHEWGACAKEESLGKFIKEQFGRETTTETNIDLSIPAEPDLRKRRAS